LLAQPGLFTVEHPVHAFLKAKRVRYATAGGNGGRWWRRWGP
jgi:hypothetical protein